MLFPHCDGKTYNERKDNSQGKNVAIFEFQPLHFSSLNLFIFFFVFFLVLIQSLSTYLHVSHSFSVGIIKFYLGDQQTTISYNKEMKLCKLQLLLRTYAVLT